MGSMVREGQKPLVERYREHPEDAVKKYHLKSEEGALDDPFHTRVKSLIGAGAGSEYAVVVDPKLGGPGGGATPGDVLLASLAACQEATVRMIANAMGIELAELVVDVTGDVDLRGTLLMDKTVPVGFRSIECRTRIRAGEGTPPAMVEKLMQTADHCCVIMSTLRHCPEIKTVYDLPS